MYTQHAIDCGINMTGKLALAVEDSAGWLLMLDIIDPVTRAPVIHAGTTMDIQLIAVAQSYGVDYVVVYHRIFPATHSVQRNLGQNPNVAAY